MRTPPLALVLLLAAGCSAPGPKGEGLVPPRAFHGFPSQSLEGIVYARARFDTDHANTFGVDLLARRRVVPIALTVHLRGEGQESAQILLVPERMELRLVLQDGTVLLPIEPEELASSLKEREASRVRRLQLEGGLLGTTAEERYVFFALRPSEDFRVDGRRIVHDRAGVLHEVDLARSLVAFDVRVGDHLQPFYVGVQ